MKGLIFTYVLCYGGSLAALFNPFIGLLVYVGFAILRPWALWPVVGQGSFSQTVAVAMLVGWAGKGFGRWDFGRGRAVMIMLGLYTSWMIVGTRFAIDPASAWDLVDLTLKIAIPCLVGATTIDSVRHLKALAWVIVLSEGYVAYEFNMTYLGGYNRLWLEGFGSLDNNGNAVALVSCVGLAIFLFFYTEGWPAKAVAGAAALLMTHAVLFSFSRGGMVALTITAIVAFLLIPKRPTHYALFALAGLVVLRLAGPQVIDRFKMSFISERGQEVSADSRLNQWSAVLSSLQSRPLGVGPHQWRLLSAQYGLPEGQAAHSTWMQVAAEMGLPGLSFLLLYYILCLVRLWPLTRESTPVPDPWLRHLARMVIASLVGFMISAQFVTIHLLEIPYYVAIMGVGVLKLSGSALAEASRAS